MLRVASRIIVVGSIILVLVLVVGGCVQRSYSGSR